MMLRRDERDKRYPERLTGSYVASLILHALLAIFLFTLASSSSQEGASESVQGGEIVTLERRAPVQPQTAQTVTSVSQPPQQITPPSAAPPVPHAPIAPHVQHAPVQRPAAQHWQLQHQELANITPNGSPNPPPVPQAPVVPQPVPTQPVFEPSPLPQVPVAPVSVNTPIPVTVAVKNPPTAAPSPMPTLAPHPVPSRIPETPRPAPSATPHPAPSAQPKPAAATAAPASPAPRATAAVAANVQASPAPKAATGTSSIPAPPAKTAGVPSPGPTRGPSIASSGAQASPGPRGQSSPGPHAGSSAANRRGPARPVHVQPGATTGNGKGVGKPSAAQLNARLKALLPTGSVTPTSKSYGGGAAYLHPQLVPTPPPDVVARTKYIYQSTDTSGSGERLVKMWVTSITRLGPIIMCSGWLVRYPAPPPMATAPGAPGASGPNLLSVSIGGSRTRTIASSGSAGQDPIIEQNVSYVCPARSLTPFKP